MCTVLRDGRDVASFHPGSEGGEAQIVAAMLAEAGRRGPRRRPGAGRQGRGERTQRLVVRDLDRPAGRRRLLRGRRRRGPGAGAWRARARTGCSRSSPATSGPPAARSSSTASRCGPGTYDAIRRGVVLVPSNRLLALLPQRPIRENIAIPLFNRVGRWGRSTPAGSGARSRTRSRGCPSTPAPPPRPGASPAGTSRS